MVDGRPFREVESNLWDPARRLEECERAGVTAQVLSTVPVMFSYWARAEHALDLSRLLNDHIAAVVADHPGRFIGLGTLPLQDPDVACRELERCRRQLGLAGVEIGTHVNGRNLDDPSLFPVFETAAQLGAAVFVHPWDMLGAERMERYWLRWLVGMPAETAVAVCSLVLGGVLERLPALRVAFAHGGGAFPAAIGRIERGYEARPDLCATDSRRNPRQALRSVYFDSLVHDPEVLRLLLRLAGPDRVALGSDYPFPLGEPAPGELVDSLEELSPAGRERVLAGTALEFLGLDPSAFPA